MDGLPGLLKTASETSPDGQTFSDLHFCHTYNRSHMLISASLVPACSDRETLSWMWVWIIHKCSYLEICGHDQHFNGKKSSHYSKSIFCFCFFCPSHYSEPSQSFLSTWNCEAPANVLTSRYGQTAPRGSQSSRRLMYVWNWSLSFVL